MQQTRHGPTADIFVLFNNVADIGQPRSRYTINSIAATAAAAAAATYSGSFN